MADRQVYITLQVKASMRVDEGTEIQEIIDEFDYSFADTTVHAQIEDTEIADYEITESK